MNKEPFIMDERAQAVNNAASSLAYTVLVFGLLADIIVRGLVAPGTNNWDLMGLIIGSGLVANLYQRIKHVPVMPRKWWIVWVVAVAVGAALTAIMKFSGMLK